MGQQLQKLKEKWRAKKQDYVLEIKRKSLHLLALLIIAGLFYLPEKLALRIFGLLVLLILFGNWYITKRNLRTKHYHEFIHQLGLPKHEAAAWKNFGKDVRKFEKIVLWDVLKNFFRSRERSLMAAFYIVFSSFMAAILFGVPCAIFGLLAIGIGDAFSTIVGKKFGRLKFIHNKEKSWEGSIAFFVSTFLAALVLLKLIPHLAVFDPAILAFTIAAAGAAIETLPTVNDNATIPIGVGFIVWLIATLV